MSDALLADLRALAEVLALREANWHAGRTYYAEGKRDAYDEAESMVRDLLAKHAPEQDEEAGR